MTQNIKDLLKQSGLSPLPGDLQTAILERIYNLEHKRSRNRLIGFGFFSLMSFGGLMVSFVKLWTNLKLAGVPEFVSLLVSDTTESFVVWREIGFSILESIPTITLSTFLTLVIIFVISGVKTVENINPKLA